MSLYKQSWTVSDMEWISVKDRLPETRGTYLVCAVFFEDARNLHVRTGYYDKVWYLDCCTNDYMITHWMPLPSLPEE